MPPSSTSLIFSVICKTRCKTTSNVACTVVFSFISKPSSSPLSSSSPSPSTSPPLSLLRPSRNAPIVDWNVISTFLPSCNRLMACWATASALMAKSIWYTIRNTRENMGLLPAPASSVPCALLVLMPKSLAISSLFCRIHSFTNSFWKSMHCRRIRIISSLRILCTASCCESVIQFTSTPL